MKLTSGLLLAAIILLAAIFRFTGVNWDNNAHLHPDERFLTMVATGITWPQTIGQYFDTAHSPLNPHNRGYSFYVYGTYPVFLVKAAADMVRMDTYDGITVVGRALSAIADLATLVVVFGIGVTVATDRKKTARESRIVGLCAAFCYAVAVLPIQLSHFFTVDPYVTLFMTLTLYRILKGKIDVVTGIMAALAVGAKASAALLFPFMFLSYCMQFPWKQAPGIGQKRIKLVADALAAAAGFFVTLRIVYPYLFVGLAGLNPLVVANWKELTSFDTPTTTFPPGLQWITVTPLQPIWDLVVLGFGMPLTLAVLVSVARLLRRSVQTKRFDRPMLLIILWTLGIGVYQAVQFTKPMRYFWPIYPTLTVLAGVGIAELLQKILKRHTGGHAVALLVCFVLLLWPIAFIHMYRVPTTRISANTWIYQHIPQRSTIAWESWDDPLPFPTLGNSPASYKTPSLPVFDPDSPKKWQTMTTILQSADYLILSSNRGYGAMGRVRDRYPETFQYYVKLFNGSLGFVPVAQFTSRPFLPVPGLSICITPPGFTYGFVSRPIAQCSPGGISVVDDGADETFTVYDHPTVIIFKKIRTLNYSGLLGM